MNLVIEDCNLEAPVVIDAKQDQAYITAYISNLTDISQLNT